MTFSRILRPFPPGSFVRSLSPFLLLAPGLPALAQSGTQPGLSSGGQTGTPSGASTGNQTPAPLPDAPGLGILSAPLPTGPTVLLDTTLGRLTCQLFDKEAPATTANFIGLATGRKTWIDPATQKQVTGKPFYDGTQFHRVIPGFMIQGGDPLANGRGDAGFYIPDEFSPALRFDVPGRLAMANSGPSTSSSQFFVTEAATPQLNGSYTIFGQCDPASVTLASAIAAVPRDPSDKPYTPVVLNRVTVVLAGQPIPSAPAVPAISTVPPASSVPVAPTPQPRR